MVGLAASPAGRPLAVGLVVRQVDAAIAGRVELTAVEVLPQGGIELRGVNVYSPEDRLVLQVTRVRLFPDLTRLGARELGAVLELDGPTVLLEDDADGGVSLARAFAPARPSPPSRPGEPLARPDWTVRLTRLAVRDGDLWWRREDGSTSAEASGITVDAEGAYGRDGAFLGLVSRADVASPVEGPLRLVAAASLRDGRLEVPVLQGSLGATELVAAGRADLATLAFRAAVSRLGVEGAAVRRLAASTAPAGDLGGAAYAESDGALLTAALDVRPEGLPLAASERVASAARAAVALRLRPPVRAVGFDVAAAGLDPSRLLAQAPPGRLTFAAAGAVAGAALADLRGRVSLQVDPSRLRGGELGPVALDARADHGDVEVTRLEARLPGLEVHGAGRWRQGGAVAGELTAASADLARLGRNLEALTGAALPPLAGRLQAKASLGGTSAAPSGKVALTSDRLAVGGARAEAVTVAAEAAGPLAGLTGKVVAAAASAGMGGVEARGPQLTAAVGGREATLTFGTRLPALGAEALTLQARAELGEDRRGAALRALELGWTGVRWSLTAPAAVTFDPPRVDRLELADGPRRLALEGGLAAKGALDARLEVVRLDLLRLPRGLLPPDLGLKGELSLSARASGTARAPVVAARLSLAGGAARGFDGLQLLGEVGWDQGARRLSADLGLLRAAGGALDLTADLPLPLSAARGAESIALTAGATGWPIEVLRQAAGVAAPLTGTLDAHLAVEGTVAGPAARAALTLDEGRLDGLGPLGASAALTLDGDAARLELAGRHGGARLLDLEVRAPLDLAHLLLDPGPVLRALADAPLTGAADLPGFDLARLAGQGPVPAELAGTLTGTAALSGTARAPRGTATVAVAGLRVAGHRDLAGRVELAAEPARTAVVVRASAGGAEALRLDGSLGAPVERLAEPAALRAAPLALEAAIPGLSLREAAGRSLPLDGRLTARLAVHGTLARPDGRLDLDGAGLVIDGRPLGALAGVVRADGARGTAELKLTPASGGVLWAGLTLAAPLGLDLTGAQLRRAPASLRITSDRLDLGFLPAVAPGLVRAASGPLTVALQAEGPLEALRPRGTIALTGARVAVVELGDWTDLALDVALGDRAIEVSRLEARRGQGRLAGRLALRELGSARATLDGRVDFQRFPLSRAGMDVVNLELPLEVTGALTEGLLDATVTIPGGTVRLPRKAPRALQPLEGRADIQVGRPAPRKASWFDAPEAGGPPARPFEARCRVVIPGQVEVLGEKPAIDLAVKADVTFKVIDGELTAEGPVEVVKGKVEPMTGRIFHVERGRVSFPGGGIPAGQLDVIARWDNPAAQVTVTIGGTIPAPTIQLTSRPAMDDAAIVALIATGRTELKANTSDISSLSGKDVGMAAAGAAMTMAFQTLLSDRLPVDQVSLDATTLRAGTQLTDRIFVGYARKFDARKDQGENENEVKAELQLTRRWNFELRYGDAQSGDASLIWSRDY